MKWRVFYFFALVTVRVQAREKPFGKGKGEKSKKSTKDRKHHKSKEHPNKEPCIPVHSKMSYENPMKDWPGPYRGEPYYGNHHSGDAYYEDPYGFDDPYYGEYSKNKHHRGKGKESKTKRSKSKKHKTKEHGHYYNDYAKYKPCPTKEPTKDTTPPPIKAPTPDQEVAIGDSFEITQDITASINCGTEGGLDQSKVEVCLLSDASGSFDDDLPNLIDASGAIFNDVSSATAEAQFGVAAFIDYPTNGFGAEDDYPYRLFSSMSSSFTDWDNGINSIVIGDGLDEPESQYDAIVGAAQGLSNSFVDESDCGWTNDPTVQRIMVVSTDAPFHTPTSVHENDLGSTTAILQGENIRLIGLKASGAGSELDSLASATGGTVRPLSSDGSDIAEAILGGLENLPCVISPIVMGCEPLEVVFEPPNQMVPPGGSATFTGIFTVPNVEGLIGTTVTCEVAFSANGDIVETEQISILITPPNP